MPLISYEESRWPIVVATWSAGEATDADIRQLLSKIDAFLARRETFVLVIDSRAGSGVSAKHRQMFGHFLRDRATPLRAHAKIALVVANAVQRGLVTAVSWLAPPSAEQKVFTNLAEAEAWGRECLELPTPTGSARL